MNNPVDILLTWLIKKQYPLSYQRLIIPYLYNVSVETVLNSDQYDPNLVVEFINQHEMTNEPIAYMCEHELFFDYPFYVNHDVLIPRIESCELVELVVNFIKANYQPTQPLTIADVCCGSGVLGISIKLLLPQYQINLIQTDISPQALKVCAINNQYHHVDGEIMCGDLLHPLITNKRIIDIIVINPPYVPNVRELDNLVKQEPHLALYSGSDGLNCYREFFKQLSCLVNQPVVFGEIDPTQKDSIKTLAEPLNVICDISGTERFFSYEPSRSTNS